MLLVGVWGQIGWTRKKTLGATERNEEERAAWRAAVSPLSAQQLFFVDECGSNIALTPIYARAPKGNEPQARCRF
jgi:hypothetical protein